MSQIKEKESHNPVHSNSLFDGSKYSEWAIGLLKNGYNLECLKILAIPDNYTDEENEESFLQAIQIPDISYGEVEEELFENYSLSVADSVITKKRSPLDGLEIMKMLAIKSNYSSKFTRFYEISEDLNNIQMNEQPLYNIDLTANNTRDYIEEEFHIFLEIEKLKKYDIESAKLICEKCGEYIIPQIRKEFRMKLPFLFIESICSKCGSENLIDLKTQNGRRKILNNLKNMHMSKVSSDNLSKNRNILD